MGARVRADVHYEDTRRDPDGWEHHLYTVTLRYQGRKMTTEFRTGIGWTEEPTASDVLESLLSDAAGIDILADGGSFEDWAGDYGYDSDSRKAEEIYHAVVKQTKKLHTLLGSDYPEGTEETEETEETARRLTVAA